eukprot:gene3034-15352_t
MADADWQRSHTDGEWQRSRTDRSLTTAQQRPAPTPHVAVGDAAPRRAG